MIILWPSRPFRLGISPATYEIAVGAPHGSGFPRWRVMARLSQRAPSSRRLLTSYRRAEALTARGTR